MPSKKFAPIQWTYGTLITDDPEALAREERSKELYGFAQVERVQRGEEKPPSPARLKADRSRAEAAAALPLKVVGTPTIDLYAREKVTGRARYPVDIYPTGVLYTKVLRSPYPHAKVTRLDTSDAERMPGVRAIVTYADMPRIARPPLTDEPSFAGEGIAAVAAETEGIAEAALRAIKVEYEQLPFVLDPREAAKPGAPLVRSDLRTNHVRDPQFSNKRGDVERGFAQADIVVESKSQTSWEQHVAMEPHSATAMWEADDRLTVWSSTQYAHGMRNGIASALAMPQSKVRVLAEHTGSGWGDKTGLLPYHVYTALLAKKAGRPVRDAGRLLGPGRLPGSPRERRRLGVRPARLQDPQRGRPRLLRAHQYGHGQPAAQRRRAGGGVLHRDIDGPGGRETEHGPPGAAPEEHRGESRPGNQPALLQQRPPRGPGAGR